MVSINNNPPENEISDQEMVVSIHPNEETKEPSVEECGQFLDFIRTKYPLPLYLLSTLKEWQTTNQETEWWGYPIKIEKRLYQKYSEASDEDHGGDKWAPPTKSRPVGPLTTISSCTITVDDFQFDFFDEKSWHKNTKDFVVAVSKMIKKWDSEQVVEAIVEDETESEAEGRLKYWIYKEGNLPEIPGITWQSSYSSVESSEGISSFPGTLPTERLEGATTFFDTHKIILLNPKGQDKEIGLITFKKGWKTGLWYAEVVGPLKEDGSTSGFNYNLNGVLEELKSSGADLRTVDIKVVEIQDSP